MANQDRIITTGMDLPRYFCDDQGREMGRNFKSIQEVVKAARSYIGEERGVFLDSFVAEAYNLHSDIFPSGDAKDAKAVIKIFLEVSIQAEEEAQAPRQPKLPNF